MKIGIIGAMLEEIEGIRAEHDWHKQHEVGARTYYEGTVHGHEIVLVFSRWGKVAAASVTTTLINLFNVDAIIFMGVAGAVAPELNIGDVVLAKNLIQHDMNAFPLFPRFEIPLVAKSYFAAEEKLNQLATQAINQALQSAELKKLPLHQFSITTPKLYHGTIASGDQFISSTDITSELSSAINNLLCVDMESAAVAQICDDYQMPFSIIRVISDKADHSAHIDFPKFIQELASPLDQLIIKNFLAVL